MRASLITYARRVRTSHGRYSMISALLLVLPLTACDAATKESATPQANATTPAGRAAGPMTKQELAWIAGITALRKPLEKDLKSTQVVMTETKMRSYEKLLGGCSPGLAQLGSPSQRLQPVYAIAKKACGQADKGARCWAQSAKIGTPIAGSANDRKFTKAMDCGFNAFGDTHNLLAEAEAKAEEIKAGVG
jgi:hypothetical protein